MRRRRAASAAIPQPPGRRVPVYARSSLAVLVATLLLCCLPPAAGAYGVALRTALVQDAPGGSDGPLSMARVRAAGAQFVHLGISWNQVAPRTQPAGFDPSNPDDPGYDWSYTDRQVSLAVSAGLEPVVSVDDAPPWAQGAGDGPDGTNSPDPAALATFFHAAAQRYSGMRAGLPRVRYWSVWNEPNNSQFLNPQLQGGLLASAALYRTMVNDAYAAVHGVHADNVLVAGELFPNAVIRPRLTGVGPLSFMRAMFCLSPGARPVKICQTQVHADVWATHPYASGGPADRPANPGGVWIGNLSDMRKLLTVAQRAGTLVSSGTLGFWVTEFAWNSNPPNAAGVPVALEQRWVAESLYRMWQSGVTLATWFHLRDDDPGSSIFQAGLYYRCAGGMACDQPKPALASFRFPFVAYAGARRRVLVWGRTPSGVPGRVVVQLSAGRGWRSLVTLRTDSDGVFTAQVRVPGRGSLRTLNLRAVRTGSGGDASPAFSLIRPPDLLVAPFG